LFRVMKAVLFHAKQSLEYFRFISQRVNA